MPVSLAQCGEPWLAQGAFPSARHGCSANGDLIVAAAIIILPSSPAPVPPASTQTTPHTPPHTPPSHPTTYTTRACLDLHLVRPNRLQYHPPPRHVNTPKSTFRIPRVSPATSSVALDFTSSNQLITSSHLLPPSIIHVHPPCNSISRPIDLAVNISVSISSPHSRLH